MLIELPITAPLLDARTQAFVDSVAVSCLHGPNHADARRCFSAIQSGLVGRRAAYVEDLRLPVGPTGSVVVRIVRPAAFEPVLPAIVYCHGGGWVMGGRRTHDRLLRDLANAAGAAIVFVDYTLAPEARYPVQNEEAYAVLEYIAVHADRLGLDPARIAVAGDGAGGNMAAALTLMAKARRGPEIVRQVLFYPITADAGGTPSYAAFSLGPWLTSSAMQAYLNAAFPDDVRGEITAFPLLASAEQLNDLPEALIILAENDVVRDEGEAYARKLIEAGVTVTATRYNGTIHDFVLLNALADTAPARAAMAQAAQCLRAAFGLED
ncbi:MULTISPECIES: alpha/beta hydrolase [Rhodomicrobium]|uniref:alpha/beta hydrolase n=1 Tax=Rhodomicrobium TaxID=1068 RepID=UPI000B4AA683|nr:MULTISPECIES: alpha/beta hydrolase [Rhodomicrobium]